MPLPRSTFPRGEGKCPYPGALSRGERGNALTPEHFPEGRGGEDLKDIRREIDRPPY